MIWDRCRRNEERQNSIEIAHAGRMISDICFFGFFRAGELLSSCKHNTNTIGDICNRYTNLFESITKAGKEWHDIEYDSHVP